MDKISRWSLHHRRSQSSALRESQKVRDWQFNKNTFLFEISAAFAKAANGLIHDK